MSLKSDLKLINYETGLVASHDVVEVEDLTNPELQVISRAIFWQLSKKRSGSANVKDMKDISGTTKKPYKQKGTGNARHGSKRSVQFVGGRTCHGPKARSFEHSLPKKIVSLSVKCALKNKLLINQLLLIDNFSNAELKTSKFSALFKKNNLDSVLLVFDKSDDISNIFKAVRNIKNVKAITFDNLNTYDLTRFKSLIVEKKLYDNKIKSFF